MPVKIICYCKTKACSIGVVLSMGILLFHADVFKLLILGYISAHVEDPKVRGNDLSIVEHEIGVKFIRNTREMHGIVKIVKISISK